MTRLVTVFKEETKEDVQKRKLESQRPLERGLSRVADDYFYHRIIGMPKRPPWTFSMTKEDLDENETEYFNKWLKDIYDTVRCPPPFLCNKALRFSFFLRARFET